MCSGRYLYLFLYLHLCLHLYQNPYLYLHLYQYLHRYRYLLLQSSSRDYSRALAVVIDLSVCNGFLKITQHLPYPRNAITYAPSMPFTLLLPSCPALFPRLLFISPSTCRQISCCLPYKSYTNTHIKTHTKRQRFAWHSRAATQRKASTKVRTHFCCGTRSLLSTNCVAFW